MPAVTAVRVRLSQLQSSMIDIRGLCTYSLYRLTAQHKVLLYCSTSTSTVLSCLPPRIRDTPLVANKRHRRCSRLPQQRKQQATAVRININKNDGALLVHAIDNSVPSRPYHTTAKITKGRCNVAICICIQHRRVDAGRATLSVTYRQTDRKARQRAALPFMHGAQKQCSDPLCPCMPLQ